MNLEFLLRARVELAPVQDLGDTPLGRRRIIAITGRFLPGLLASASARRAI